MEDQTRRRSATEVENIKFVPLAVTVIRSLVDHLVTSHQIYASNFRPDPGKPVDEEDADRGTLALCHCALSYTVHAPLK